MTSTVNKPATALPWIARDTSIRDSRGRLTATPEEKGDAAYIAHACNSYPRLVEMLLRAALDENYEADDCLRLLRDLGELE